MLSRILNAQTLLRNRFIFGLFSVPSGRGSGQAACGSNELDGFNKEGRGLTWEVSRPNTP